MNSLDWQKVSYVYLSRKCTADFCLVLLTVRGSTGIVAIVNEGNGSYCSISVVYLHVIPQSFQLISITIHRFTVSWLSNLCLLFSSIQVVEYTMWWMGQWYSSTVQWSLLMLPSPGLRMEVQWSLMCLTCMRGPAVIALAPPQCWLWTAYNPLIMECTSVQLWMEGALEEEGMWP